MKNSIKKILASAAALSMLATSAAAVSAEDAPATTDDAKADIVNVENTNGDTALYLADGTTTVADFAFQDAVLGNVFVPDSFVTEGTGNLAFLTKNMIDTYVSKELIVDAADNKDEAKYIAKVIKFGGKTEGWTDEELATVAGVFTANLIVVGYDPANADPADDYGKAVCAIIKKFYADGKKTVAPDAKENPDNLLYMSQKSADLFDLWVNTITYDGLTIIANEGSQAEAYAKGREALGAKFVIRGDANSDNKFNVRDAAAIANALAHNKACVVAADYNLDAKVNVRDAAAIANYLAHKK